MSLFKRRIWLVNVDFQFGYIGVMVAIGFLSGALFYAGHLLVLHSLRAKVRLLGGPSADQTLDLISQTVPAVNMVFFGVSLLQILLFLILGLWLSNRVAGPLFRLREHILRIARGGKPEPINFRDGDYFQEVATAVNELISAAKPERPGPTQR